jgi:hypothetical protein
VTVLQPTDSERDEADRFYMENGIKSFLMIVQERFDLTRDRAIEWLEHTRKVNDLMKKLGRVPAAVDGSEGGP